MTKPRVKFKLVDNKVVYGKMLHSQELAVGDLPNNETPLKGLLRKKIALKVADMTV